MSREPAALEARGLVMRYGRRRDPVLRDCSFRLPAGRICALVGPNGAGKSTLLALAAGILRPTGGTLRVLGAGPAESRPRIGYVAQTRPLHPQLTVAETLRLGAELNRGRWDQEAAERAAYAAGLDPKTRIRTLSGGQRTRVALALALGKRSELLLLDEPMADLDPVARHQLMGTLLAVAVEHGTSVVMSSHVLTELEGACDYVLLLGGGQIRLAGESEEVLTAHARLTGTSSDFTPHAVVESGATGRGHTALVRPRGPVDTASWLVEQPSMEELILTHLRNPGAPALFTRSASSAPSQEAVA
ncbi:ABC transporter ATP-binding protein [Streptomyces agglomeratus]|uniref:ABC transporter ATP-binding protein n=1 Tax=Streptomyces agglomeratus TaxID=285458 RepID=A0A1E5P227_9ACTN|nr:ABC transporter ATP-binding protein [Streptomyces agglomeratus]OEJ23586.1 ABC transporter ATP-binding protein [Streptomyces agglomeratus]OEJ54899.1 ABC transporter ATP-binding protein [Streptomyces agglomeratus]